jgi:hypothetical protein
MLLRPLHMREAPGATVLFWLLAAGALAVGVWAQFFPASFYADFPGGRGWVSADGAFNEHLVRDVGGLQLALAAVTGWAASRRAGPGARRAVALAWLLFAVPHLTYHATHLQPFGVTDAVAQVVALALQVVAPLWVLLGPSGRAGDSPTRATPQ